MNFANKSFLLSTVIIMFLNLMIFTGCAKPDGNTGSIIGGGLGGITDSLICQISDQASYAIEPVGTASSPDLYVGRYLGVEIHALLRFLRPALPYSWSVDSARVDITYQGHIGTGGFPEIHGEAVDYYWTEASTPANDEIPAGTSLQSDFTYPAADTGSISYTLPIDYVTDWLNFQYTGEDTAWTDTTRADSALSIHLINNPVRMAVSYARIKSRTTPEDSTTGELRPRLRIFITASDTIGGVVYAKELVVTPIADVFMPVYDDTELSPNLTVGSGVVFRSLLKFDLTPIEQLLLTDDVVITRAEMTLMRDTTTFPDSLPMTQSIWPYKVTNDDWLTDPDAAELAVISINSIGLDLTAANHDLLVTSLVAGWTRDLTSNHGMAILSGGEGLGLNRIHFYGLNDPPDKQPYLTVYYTRFPR